MYGVLQVVLLQVEVLKQVVFVRQGGLLVLGREQELSVVQEKWLLPLAWPGELVCSM